MTKMLSAAVALIAALALTPAALGAPCADCEPGGGGGGGGTPNVLPTAAFSSAPATPQTLQDVTFTNSSSDSDGSISSVSWDFGDGGTSTTFSPTHQYANGGVYTVTLSVTDNDHATSSVSHQVTVSNRAPTSMFAISNVVNPGGDLGIQNLSSDPEGHVAAYHWDFGDGTSSTDANPLKSYTAVGMYTVSLKVIDDKGAETVSSQPVRVNAAPTVEILAGANATAGTAVQFNSIANDADGTVEGYSWDFGDGSNGSGAVPSHTYGAAGTYTVKLTVIDNNFATGNDEVTIEVVAAPVNNGGGGGENGGENGGATGGGGSNTGGLTGGGTTTTGGGSTGGNSVTGGGTDTPGGDVAQSGGDKTAPALVVPAKLKAKKKAGKLAYTVSINEAATIVAKLKGKVAGTAKVKITKAGKGKIVIKLSSKAKKSLKAAKNVKLTLTTTATDAAGNKTTKTTKVTIV